MVLGSKYKCPNITCNNTKTGKKGEFCPDCGAALEKMDVAKKNRLKTAKKAVTDGHKMILFQEDMTDDEIEQQIYQDMSNLHMHEAGTAWMRAGTLLSMNTTNQMLGAGFKAIIDQNKILIRQNELLLRQLKNRE